ncbi:MAG: DUF4367 domain-containing protein [Oscillospiraceae bacterium]|nr:DUF4367 domain-containing protein [Oscillospiraceae bacterium]
MTFDDLIVQGMRGTLEEKRNVYRLDEKNHLFSIAYKIRRKSIIRSSRSKTRFTVRKIKYILIAVIMALFVLTGFSLWRYFGGFYFNFLEDHSTVFFKGENFKTTIEEVYGLPEEYELLKISSEKYNVISKYLINGEIITLTQNLSSLVEGVNTENCEVEYLTINGNDGYYINMFEDVVYLTWVNDGYLFTLIGKIDKNAAIFLAKSLKIRNFDKNP